MISALLFDTGKLARAFFAALRDGKVLLSADVVSEISEVLGREKFRRYVTEEERARFLRSLLQEAELIEIEEKIQACRDPKDDKFLELAVNGTAGCIVTGDDDLLTLNPFRDVEIITPDAFLRTQSRDDM